MRKIIILLIIFCGFNNLFAQEEINDFFAEDIVVQKNKLKKKKSLKDIPLDSVKNQYGARYVDYKKITHVFDTIQIDTVLELKNYFKHNYTQKDDFELVAFANQGQGFNILGYNFINNKITPIFGATMKLFDYNAVEDTEYFHVPTPTTILNYRSGFDGQYLNSLFTANFSKFSNFSVAYRGLRSTGEYQRSRASHTNFRTTYTYYNPEKRYQFRTHFISQKLENLENGGITDESIVLFKDDNPDFSSRSRVNVNLASSQSFLKADRFYFEHELRLVSSKDSLKQNLTNLKLGHILNVESSKYQFDSSDSDYFNENIDFYGEPTVEDLIRDKTELSSVENQVYLKFNSPWILGNFKVFGQTNNIEQKYDDIKRLEVININKKRNIDYSSFGAIWNGKYKGIFLNAATQQVLSGEHLNSNLHINAGFNLKNNISANAGLQLKTQTPNLNTTVNQSSFTNFNWNQEFDSESYRTIYGSIHTKWANASVNLHQIENYAYFNENSVASQYTQVIDYLKIRINSNLKFGKFHFDNSIQYQKVTQGDEVLRVPEIISRNTLYYEDYFFKGDPLLAQIGFTFKYFSKYYANDYNPVLNEFYIQNQTEIGDYPTFNVFLNGKLRRTRIYFIVENISDSLTGRNYFATRNQPGRDLTMRLGLVWNFWN